MILLLCAFVLLQQLASCEETNPMYAYVYPGPRTDDYFTHYKTWSKGHGYYINPAPYKECKEVGQVLMDPEDSKCCYLVCDYGPRPRFDVKVGRYDLFVRRNKCPLGTRIGDDFAVLSKKPNYLKKFLRTPCSRHDLTKICSEKYYIRKPMKDGDGENGENIQYISVGGPIDTSAATTPKYKEVYF